MRSPARGVRSRESPCAALSPEPRIDRPKIAAMRTLLVSSDRALVEDATRPFVARGHPVDAAHAWEDCELLLRTVAFSLVILDLALTPEDGLEVLARFHGFARLRRLARLPVLALAASDGVAERIAALNRGADDCLGRPISVPELEARAAALVRRGAAGGGATLGLGKVSVDTAARRVRIAGRRLQLGNREFCLLEELLLQPGRVVSKRALFDRVFDSTSEAGIGALELYVHRLRRKLALSGVGIRTVRTIGYAIELEERRGRAERTVGEPALADASSGGD